jgi:hypothetical protein
VLGAAGNIIWSIIAWQNIPPTLVLGQVNDNLVDQWVDYDDNDILAKKTFARLILCDVERCN